MGHAKVILGLITPDAQVQLARRLIKEQLSVREAEKLLQHQPQARRSGKRSMRQPRFGPISRSACRKDWAPE